MRLTRLWLYLTDGLVEEVRWEGPGSHSTDQGERRG